MVDTAYKVKAANPDGDVFIGTEVIFYKQVGFKILNWRDPLIIQRIHGLIESGISNEIMNFRKIAFNLKVVRLNDVLNPRFKSGPEALKITSNISGIFAIFAIGVSVSLLVLILEFWQKIYDYLHIFFTCCNQNLIHFKLMILKSVRYKPKRRKCVQKHKVKRTKKC